MQNYEIGFGELRRTYQEVRTLIKESTGLTDKEFGIYSTLEEDLGLYDLDYDELEEKFIQQFAVQITTQNVVTPTHSVLQTIKHFLLYILNSFSLFVALPFGFTWFLMQYFWYQINPIKMPSKKQWQQDQLTLVSIAVLKKFVQKKDVIFTLRKVS